MDNKDSGSNFALWIPGGAVILSLVVSTFALTRAPFLEPRPVGGQFQAQMPIEARLWQDPFDALERYRKKLKESRELNGDEQKIDLCTSQVAPELVTPGTRVMVAVLEGGPYADEVELRRRVRYAVLAGFKNAHLVPEDEQHIRCLKPEQKLPASAMREEIPYESLVSNPLDPPRNLMGQPRPNERTLLFWVKQEYLEPDPLVRLQDLRGYLARQVSPDGTQAEPMKVIGPSTSSLLQQMYLNARDRKYADLEIYSPLATAERNLLLCGKVVPSREMRRLGCTSPVDNKATLEQVNENMKLLRTVSDDGRLSSLLLDELRLRHVDPVNGVQCSRGVSLRSGTECQAANALYGGGRIALISEWDSYYSRALTESFRARVVDRARLNGEDRDMVDDWVLRFSYLRGIDGRLPEQAGKAPDKAPATPDKSTSQVHGALESADGDTQLDYLRRLADHIARLDENYRRNGEYGISAIGVLGTDAYDKLLVLQALKGRLPNKLYFSTDLDARMLQAGQTETTRNLVLASPYGLTLTQALQQDVPPFRDSLQSAVFVAVLAALSERDFAYKQAKFDPSGASLLSPGIYEIGASGFIPLASRLRAARGAYCEAPRSRRSWAAGEGLPAKTQDIMALSCLQDAPPPPYPQITDALQGRLDAVMSMWRGGWLVLLVAALMLFLGWWWVDELQDRKHRRSELPGWVRRLPLAFYLAAGLFAWVAALQWRVQLIWITFVLILLGLLTAQLIRRHREMESDDPKTRPVPGGLFDSSIYYLALPSVIFVLTLLWGYQSRQMLTENGLGEPMFLFEGISAWPTMALRVLALLISISALAWGWRCLRLNRQEIEREYCLVHAPGLWSRFPAWRAKKSKGPWLRRFGAYLLLVLFPLSAQSLKSLPPVPLSQGSYPGSDGRPFIDLQAFWREHCLGGAFGARLLRAALATWIFAAATGVLYVLWPLDGMPIRGELLVGKAPWMLPVLAFQLLVFWVVDANWLLSRFIRQLINHHAKWPYELERQHQQIFGVPRHACIDDWVDINLIARRTAAVSRLIYAPTVVLLILIASRSSLFDNWPTPPGLVISFVLTGLILFFSALGLRRAAEKARAQALQHFDSYLLRENRNNPEYAKFEAIRAHIAGLKTGAFSRYSEEPLVRALLLSLTGIGGSIIVDALNFAKF